MFSLYVNIELTKKYITFDKIPMNKKFAYCLKSSPNVYERMAYSSAQIFKKYINFFLLHEAGGWR
jgi:hypothetical protein